MEKYEKSIGFGTLRLSFVRHFLEMGALFGLLSIGSFLAIRFSITPTYASEATISKSTIVSSAQYELLTINIKNKETASQVATNVANRNIKHSGGTAVTQEEIYSGIFFNAYMSNSLSLTFRFQSSDSVIVQPVMEELTNYSVETIRVSFATDFSTLVISKDASKPIKTSNERRYTVIALGTSALVAIVTGFVLEALDDTVFDIREFNDKGFRIGPFRKEREKN